MGKPPKGIRSLSCYFTACKASSQIPKEFISLKKDLAGAKSFYLERAKGIEPSYSAWEADVLPLNYARKTSLNIWDFSIISPKLGKVNAPGKFFRVGRIC